MKILMMTNTYAPMVGGIEESIRSFTLAFEQLGHEVFVVTPECEGAPPDEVGVIRLRAIQKFNNSDFSIALPMSSLLPELMKTFVPDIIHCHHPFWMGDIALRLSRQYRIPLVFTYHTMFEQHMHYLPIQNDGVKRFIIELFAGYANLANQVIVPSESVRVILIERGVTSPMTVVPTGIDLEKFAKGRGSAFRKRFSIPGQAVVIGYVGRLALEKNLEFLSRCVAAYLKKETKVHFLVGGEGPLKDLIKQIFEQEGLSSRLHLTGNLKGQDLVDGYHAMNIFAFASLSETQGIVLVEAMAAGVPVVALDAPGVREVVKDGYNGRLLFGQNQNNFLQALDWCLHQPPQEFQQMQKNAQASTKEFSIELCADRMLKVYQDVKIKEYISPDHEHSPWNSLAGRLKNEWDMFKNMLQSGGAAIVDTSSLEKPIVKNKRNLFLYLPRLLSLSEWSARLLHLPRAEGVETEPGLVMIQIDGFSGQQLSAALARHEIPFLQGLLQNEYYKLYPHYSGLPSSTPSVQAELFYGIKQAVPAFAFFDRKAGKIFRMYDSQAVQEIERRLASQGPGLLENGSSYSNIYSGGAKESHFCAASLGWDRIWREVNPVTFTILAFTHLPSFLRMLVLTIWELMLGAVDFIRGVVGGRDLKKEWTFIYLRSLICILLRELVTLGTKIDIVRGLPIIHLNLLGYDELAHHSGPSSHLAHWSLPGIDRAIERIYRKALHSPQRSYDVWIYSDHGQEDTISYTQQYYRTVENAIREVYKEFDAKSDIYHDIDRNGVQSQRARFLGLSFLERLFYDPSFEPDPTLASKLVITAIGPTGNIYLPREMNQEQKHRFARELIQKAKIPVVLSAEELGQVHVWMEEGEFSLPQDAKKILGEEHPYLEQVTDDLIRICHHPNAGDFTFLGYKAKAAAMTFPSERGSHAGPGPHETNGFALLPIDVIAQSNTRAYLTPTDLRLAALKFLKRPVPAELNKPPEIVIPQAVSFTPKTIRIMTYNVHSCIGMDGKISPRRIARVIGRHQPDIVALQELDVGRYRTGVVDQPHLIADELEMIYHFHPNIIVDRERYGNAMLSRYPMTLIRAECLPGVAKTPLAEPRGMIWTMIEVGGIKINFFNTHFSLYPHEAILQARALIGPDWLKHPQCVGPVIVCGDFNSLPQSPVCRQIKKVLRDAQGELDDHRPKATWFSHYPVGRIDHVFLGPDLVVTRVDVSRTDLDRISSDHLPLIVDIKLSDDKAIDLKP